MTNQNDAAVRRCEQCGGRLEGDEIEICDGCYHENKMVAEGERRAMARTIALCLAGMD